MELNYHIPALLDETIEGLNIQPNGIYVDLTLGGGGHSKAILNSLKEGKLYSFDQDEDALANNKIKDPRFTLIQSNFKFLKRFLLYYKCEKVDGILADLGVSFHHFDTDQRGFSFRFDAPLDMRMNQKSILSAFEVVNSYSEEELSNIFYLYGELRNSRKIAHTIVIERNNKKISTTTELIETISPLVGNKHAEHKFFAQVFQALRIEVNKEMETLELMLQQALTSLKPGGRIAILTYHSLEDRMVKNFFKSGNIQGKTSSDIYGNVKSPLKIINKKVITPSPEEIKINNRSRSAKLRIAEYV